MSSEQIFPFTPAASIESQDLSAESEVDRHFDRLIEIYSQIDEEDDDKSGTTEEYEVVDQRKPSKIHVQYDGNYSNQLTWDYDIFDAFSDRSDLRTDITITSARTQSGQHSVDQLGDTLIMKRLGNPMELFSRKSHVTPALEVSTNFVTGEALIGIDDQVITQRLLEQGSRVDSEIFAQKVNQLTRLGITSILKQEKKLQSIMSARVHGQAAIGAGTALGAITLFGKGTYDVVSYLWTSDFSNYIQGIGEVMGSGIVSSVGRVSMEALQHDPSKPQISDKYVQSWNDVFNIPDHVTHAGRGIRYLTIPRKQMVSAKK